LQVEESISVDQMTLVLEVSRHLAVTPDLDALLREIVNAAMRLLHAERASIFLHDPGPDQLWTKIAHGTGEIRIPAHAGIVGSAFKGNCLINIPVAYEDPRFNREIDKKTGFTTRNLLTAPMVNLQGNPVGAIQIINKIGGVFGTADEMLVQLLADQAGVAIQRYHLQQAAIKTIELQREMDLAKKVQDALIPKTLPDCAGLDCAGWNQSASTTGGDAYDLWRLPDGRLAAFLADASGHGLAPALVVSQARTLVRALATLEPSPAKILAAVNARLAEDLEGGMFVTAFLAFVDAGGALNWFSAGHGPVLIRRGVGMELEVLDPQAPPLGVINEWAEEPSCPYQLSPGGALILCSDGIFESFNPEMEQFGQERVTDILEKTRANSANETLALLRSEVHAWQRGREPSDDQTIVLIKRPE
jgi:phosphoserine phosphatase RsbU/P